MKINFLGNGSGFTNSHTNAYFEKEDDLVIIDLSMINYGKIMDFPLSKYKNIHILITHMHPDHVSGVGMLVQYCYYVLKRKLNIIALNGILENITKFLDLQGIPEEIYIKNNPTKEKYEWIKKIYCTRHAPELDAECFGYMLDVDGTNCIYTGDTSTLDVYKEDIIPGREIYIDVSYSYGGVHLKYDDIKEQLMEYTKNNVKVYLIHLDDEESIRRIIDGTKIKIADIISPNYYSDEELQALKYELCFNKKDIINMLYNLAQNNDEERLVVWLTKQINEIENIEIEPIIPDFTKKEIKTYYIDTVDLEIKKGKATDFLFYYDNPGKQLIVSSYTFLEED